MSYGELLRLEPHSLFRRCYDLIRLRRARGSIALPDLYILVLMGLASAGLKEMRYCEFCPRWARPGAALCIHHSQADTAPGTRSEKAARYRLGREIGETYRRHVPEAPSSVELTTMTLPSYIAQLLWRPAAPNEARSAAAVRRHIAGSPGLQRLIGEDFDSLGNNRLYSRLQQVVNPYEVRPTAWLWKLRLLRLWLGYEASMGAQPRKIQRHAWLRLVKASVLEEEGFTKAEIARALNVSPSAISNWLSRYGAHSLQEAVRKHIDDRRMSLRTDRISSLDGTADETLS